MQLPFGRKEAPRAKGAGADDTRSRAAAGGSKGPKGATAGRSSARAGRAEGPSIFGAPALIMGPRLLFIFAVLALCILGMVMIYSASSITAYSDADFGNDSTYFFKKQVIWLALGLAACLVCAFAPYRLWADTRVAWALHGVALLLLIAVAAGLGSTQLGADRSISIAGFSIQPAEFAKITTLLFLASHLERVREGSLEFWRGIAICLVVLVITMLLIYKQPDLGTAMILFVGVLALMILYGFPAWVIAAAVGLVVLYFVAVSFLQPYHLDRITTFLDPWADAQDSGYQSVQGFLAFGSGGIFGTGLGLSRQKYNYLPYAYNDFIFAVIGEELGLIGAAGTLLLFALFIYAGLRISHMAPDQYAAVVSGSMTSMIGFQACLNMACVVGIAPVTGKALPFISYGGSSLLATMIMVGLILGVSRASRLDIASERRRDNLLVMDGGRSAARERGQEGRAPQPGGLAGLKEQLAARLGRGGQVGGYDPRGSQRGGYYDDAARGSQRGGSYGSARGSQRAGGSRGGQAGSVHGTRGTSARGGQPGAGGAQRSQQTRSQRSAQGAQDARRSRRGGDLDVELVDIAPRTRGSQPRGQRSGSSGRPASSQPRSSQPRSAQGNGSKGGGSKKQVRYDNHPKTR
ncbi:MAG: putative lipid II flippase FtsW [Coriobacteriaceae bacterium]|nr:putative lipid II flippase FtsW [Coriobacteriaceae bacterium]